MPGMYPSSRNKSQPAASHSRATREETIVANRLDGKVVAITGGSQGIGLAIAERFAQEGADVAFCYRSNKAGAEEVAAGIRKLGRKAVGFQYDVGRVAEGQKFIADAAAQFGRIGIPINNIAPGAIETPINTKLLNDPVKLNALLENIPLKRLGKPEDVASMAVFLASSDSDYATGTTFFVDGGLTWNYQEQ